MNLVTDYKNKDIAYRVHIGDMLKVQDIDGIGVTTNGYINKNLINTMGIGIAKSISKIYPSIPKILGNMIHVFGNNVFLLKVDDNKHIFNIPVKPSIGDTQDILPHLKDRFKMGMVPGYAVKADINLIEKSLIQLVELVNCYGLEDVVLPLVGCGAGGLILTDVKPLLDRYLDDRFIICSYRESDFEY